MTDQENKPVPKLNEAAPQDGAEAEAKASVSADEAALKATDSEMDSVEPFAESKAKASAIKRPAESVEVTQEPPVKQDGIDKLMAFAGLQPKDKKFVMIGAAALVVFLVFTVFGDRQRLSGFNDDGVQDFSGAATSGEARGALVVLLDPDLLIRAAVGQTVAAQGDAGKMVDTGKLGDVIRSTVKQYRDNGYIILNKSAALAFPASTDLTRTIAKDVGINLEYAEMDVFTGENAPVDANVVAE